MGDNDKPGAPSGPELLSDTPPEGATTENAAQRLSLPTDDEIARAVDSIRTVEDRSSPGEIPVPPYLQSTARSERRPAGTASAGPGPEDLGAPRLLKPESPRPTPPPTDSIGSIPIHDSSDFEGGRPATGSPRQGWPVAPIIIILAVLAILAVVAVLREAKAESSPDDSSPEVRHINRVRLSSPGEPPRVDAPTTGST